MRQNQDTSQTLAPICDHETYTLASFMKAAGWGRAALRTARDNGLRVIKISGRCFVRGRDFSEWLGIRRAVG